MRRHKVVSIGHCAHNFFPVGSGEKVRGFAELPNVRPSGEAVIPSAELEQLLDQGYRILSAQTAGGALDHGFYSVTTYVLEAPEGVA